jgi:hypothetical protein
MSWQALRTNFFIFLLEGETSTGEWRGYDVQTESKPLFFGLEW